MSKEFQRKVIEGFCYHCQKEGCGEAFLDKYEGQAHSMQGNGHAVFQGLKANCAMHIKQKSGSLH